MDFSNDIDDLQQHVSSMKSSAQAAVREDGSADSRFRRKSRRDGRRLG